MKKDLLTTFQYFAQFSYPPSFDEIYTFLHVRAGREELQRVLNRFERARTIVRKKIKSEVRYTMEGYSIYFKKYIDRTIYSEHKISNFKFQIFKKILSLFPQIKLIGISGSLSMMNAKRTDDIDLFIITDSRRLWTGRFIAMVIAEVLGIRRRRNQMHTQDRVCLNLFMDKSHLAIPPMKRSYYVAHEVLQMKPTILKDDIYERFLHVNKWVFDIFPNALDMVRLGKKNKKKMRSLGLRVVQKVGDLVENILKRVQKKFIKKHQTTEHVTDTQLWFHPKDVEKELARGVNSGYASTPRAAPHSGNGSKNVYTPVFPVS